MKLQTWIKYGLLYGLLGFIVGIVIAIIAIGEGYFLMAMVLPLAAFLTGSLFWKLIVKDKMTKTRIVITGLLTGTIVYYIASLLLCIGMIISHFIGFGNGLLDLPSMFMGTLGASILGFFFFGWITVPLAVLIGFGVKRMEDRKE